MQLHYSRTSNINDNKRLYEQVKDLHLGEWLLSQTPAEELDEIKFTTECSISYHCHCGTIADIKPLRFQRKVFHH